MTRRIRDALIDEHSEVVEELRRCLLGGERVDQPRFDAFRQTLLRHITIEEKVLRPALVARGCSPLFQNELRRAHAGIVALCLPKPCKEWIVDLAELLEHHHHVEEAAGGFYARVEELILEQAEVQAQIAALEPLELPAFEDGPRLQTLIERLLVETGIKAVV